MKKKLLVSFSGGETSAFMAKWLWDNKRDEFEMVFVFANTGQEREETLVFVEKCSDYFGFPVVWIESSVFHGVRKSSGHKVVSFETAARNGEPFEDMIKKYGIPNQVYPHCTRELKIRPIESYARSIGWRYYFTAIGIRLDEIDRVNSKASVRRLIYPLIRDIPMTKPKINSWWRDQPFRLQLKGYQGNCKWCWKKSDRKLFTLVKEDEQLFDFPLRMELKYGSYFPGERGFKRDGSLGPIVFFRKNRSAADIIEQGRVFEGVVSDSSIDYRVQLGLIDDTDLLGGESCEVWAECGMD